MREISKCLTIGKKVIHWLSLHRSGLYQEYFCFSLLSNEITGNDFIRSISLIFTENVT